MTQTPRSSLSSFLHIIRDLTIRDALARRGTDPAEAAFTVGFFTRMLFSCLVDADFLDTERFMAAGKAEHRPEWPDDILERMKESLEAHVLELPSDGSPVNRERRRVREACLAAAEDPPGLFSLTVPTGGGKTLSSLAFALEHAYRHGLERIVYVIPFTSIIEQNAKVFRKAMKRVVEAGLPDPVIEHHSILEADEDSPERLAAENWDAPLIVTTSVQFYESIFADRPSRCRKLHNLCRAVIVLDEAQKIPVDSLRPCLLALQELVANYGSTVLLCTATQPAIHAREDFPIGLRGVREIIRDPQRLYLSLKRAEVRHLGRQSDAELMERLQEEEQVLCIVNTRGHARALFGAIRDRTGAFHLSAAMCPAHRSERLQAIRDRLEAGKECRVISTQLVEAGVDLDFPVVYRSLAGLDSIAQAAGRCNREGRRARGVTYVFRSEHDLSEAFLRDTSDAAAQIMGDGSGTALYPDLLSLEAVEHYFRLYYWSQQERWDAHRILDELRITNNRQIPFLFGFRTIGRRFRVISDAGKSVLVPWQGVGAALCAELRQTEGLLPPELLRKLQRYSVQIRERQWARHLGRSIELVRDCYPILIDPDRHYDRELGLVLDEELDAHSALIV